VTIGFTPVLANQLADPAFGRGMDAFFALRLAACDEPKALPASRGDSLLPLVAFGRPVRQLAAAIPRDRSQRRGRVSQIEHEGRLEIIGSAATHGYPPLLGETRAFGYSSPWGAGHERLFGRQPAGCWVPECAYRPRGVWSARAEDVVRHGTEEHLADAGSATALHRRARRRRAGGVLTGYSGIPVAAQTDEERHEELSRPAGRQAPACTRASPRPVPA
jgi:1,4-alpha-glucan branching enzyme